MLEAAGGAPDALKGPVSAVVCYLSGYLRGPLRG